MRMYIAYRVMLLPDIRRVVRGEKEEMVDEGGSLGNGPKCNKKRKERRKDDGRHGEGSRSIIAETGNILTGGRT